jgi:thioredoxin reductase (NADPH)
MVADNTKKLVIIGSGPAGLTAAIYAARGGVEPFVISGNKPGGQLMLTTDVENYPGFPENIHGPDLMANMRKQAEKFGTKFTDGAAVSVDFSSRPFKINVGEQQQYFAEVVIIATGSSSIALGLESEERLVGRGVSYCATCDGFFFKGKDVVVVGGGDTAVSEAIFLSKVVSSVKIIHRKDRLRAEKILQQRAFKNQKISFVWNSVVEEILGQNKVEGLRLRNVHTGEKSEIKCASVFIAIGHKPNTDAFKGQVQLDNRGYIRRYNESKTSVEGIFVAGDVYDYVYKQAVTAAGTGCKAAADIIRFLEASEQK